MDADTLRRKATAEATRSMTRAMRLQNEAKVKAFRDHAELIWPHRACAFVDDPRPSV